MTRDELFVFDLDGTVLRSNEVDERAYLMAARETFGSLDQISTDWSDYPDATDTVIFDALADLAGVPEELRGMTERRFRFRFGEILNAELRRDPSLVEPAPGIGALLEELGGGAGHEIHSRGAIATGGYGHTATAKLRRAGLGGIVTPIRCCDDARVRVEIIRSAARAIGAEGEDLRRVTYFGDGLWDRKACAELGIRFVGVALDDRVRERFEQAGVAPVIDRFPDAGGLEALVGSAPVAG